jgi:hypothetical protein
MKCLILVRCKERLQPNGHENDFSISLLTSTDRRARYVDFWGCIT